MYELLEILKYTVPALVVLLTAYLILKKFLDFNAKHLVVMQQSYELEKQKLEADVKRKREEAIIPLRLQAYERLVLFLERINPPNLVTRELQSGLKADGFHKILLTDIRDEFEHNMSQQIYLSNSAWNHVKIAKEEVSSLINKSIREVNPSDAAVKLGETILSHPFEAQNNPIDLALAALKNDLRTQFS